MVTYCRVVDIAGEGVGHNRNSAVVEDLNCIHFHTGVAVERRNRY